MKYLLILLTLLALGGVLTFMTRPQFGSAPDARQSTRFSAAGNFADGVFHNRHATPLFTSTGSAVTAMWKFVTRDTAALRPDRALPIVKSDLHALNPASDILVWLGHSSVYAHIGGQRILIDPVLSDHAAPFAFMNRAFDKRYPYQPDDFPAIDCLVISHDHWDHLDYQSLMALKTKIRAIVCPLGVGAHLEYWGFAPAIIHEAAWNESVRLNAYLTIHVLPAQHFSGRFFSRNKTLWASFLLEGAGRNVFYSGDSGYGPHFSEIGERFGMIDLALLDTGQYDPAWRHHHMMPEDSARAASDLRARAFLPVHSGRFVIANHAWDDPYRRVSIAAKAYAYRLLTPMMGEVLELDASSRAFGQWWESP